MEPEDHQQMNNEPEWDVSEPFEYVNEEDAQLQFPDSERVHPEYLQGWDQDNQSGVKVRLVEVVHGYAQGDKHKPRTLIVFEFVLVTGRSKERLRDVSITVGFRATGTRDGVRKGGNISAWDPKPVQWAPGELLTLSHFSKALATDTQQDEGDIRVGYDPYLGGGWKRGRGSTLAVQRIHYRYITSTPARFQKNSGEVNAMKWELAENVAMQSGVQGHVRTAVLVRRKKWDDGTFDIFTDIRASDSVSDKVMRVFRKILPRRAGTATFDPRVLPGSSDGEEGDDDVAARATKRDYMNLDKADLEDVLVKDWGVGSADGLGSLAPPPPPPDADGAPEEASEEG